MFDGIFQLVIATSLLLGSPGPAPLALAATGTTVGVRKGMPFLLGVLAGLLMVTVGVALGLAGLIASSPRLSYFLQILGMAYFLYVAYKIASAPVLSDSSGSNPPCFKDGFILNLINPKAYAALFALFSQHLVPYDSQLESYLVTGFICLLVATFVDLVWLCLGGVLKPIFINPTRALAVRVVFAILILFVVLNTLLTQEF